MEILYILVSFLGGALGGGLVFLFNKNSINYKYKKDKEQPHTECFYQTNPIRIELFNKLNRVSLHFIEILIRIVDASNHKMAEEEVIPIEKSCSIHCKDCPGYPCLYYSEDVEITFKNRSIPTNQTTNKDD